VLRETPPIDRPIFVVGMPRSGTTLVLEALAARDDLAWFSRPMNRFPALPVLSVLERLAALHPYLRSTAYRSDQQGAGGRALRRLERLRLGPTEGIPVWRRWFGARVSHEFMLGAEATEPERQRARRLVAKLLRYQGKRRFVAKITGPGRIGYLSSLFGDCRFLHVIRDGRAVVNSLMRFPAWRETFRFHKPAWSGGLTEDDLATWRDCGSSPLALAAIEWRAVVETTRREAARLGDGRYTELRYEDFVADPHSGLDELTEFCGLAPAPAAHDFLDRRIRPRDMNYRWKHELGSEEIELLDRVAGELLIELGYR
jgi:omega-hydroxy-beta-dihydromenaquinone-9 sulfotransferase